MDRKAEQGAPAALLHAEVGDKLYRANVEPGGEVLVLAYEVKRSGEREAHILDLRNPSWRPSRDSWESLARSHGRTPRDAIALAIANTEDALRSAYKRISRYEAELDALRIALTNAESSNG